MMKKQHIENAAKILKAMGNERRLEVLYNLYAVESNVGELEKKVRLSQSALSQHLAVLRNENIVKTMALVELARSFNVPAKPKPSTNGKISKIAI